MVGLKWNAIQQIVFQVINYGSLLVLANLISAENFGAVALSTVLVGLFEILNGFGMGPLIIKDKIRDDRKVSTLFWLALGLSFLLFAAVLAVGIFYAGFYRPSDPLGLYLILAVSAFTIPLNGMNAIFSAQYMRDLDFKFSAVSGTGGIICAAAVAIVLAWFKQGVWALVAKNMIPVLTQNVCFWWHGRYKVRFYYDRLYARSTWTFTSQFSSFSVVNYLIRNLDYVVIGKFFNEAIVGQYSLAYKLMLFPLKNISARVHTVFYPVLAGVKESPEAVSRIYFKAVMAISYLAFPIMFIASALADLWVPILFRQDFPYLANLIKILAVVGAFQATTSAVGILFLISNRTDALLKTACLLLFVLGGGFVLGGLSGDINVFALVYGALYLFVVFPLSNLIPFRLTGLRMQSLFRAILPSLAGALAAAAASWLMAQWLHQQPGVLRLSAALAAGTTVYLGVIQVISGRTPTQNIAFCWGLVREARH